jgi:tetratricopeptide (TPR) repeat protein
VQTSEALATALRAQGEYSMEAHLLRETLARYAVHQEEKALILNLLADSMREEGKSSAAQTTFRDVLRMQGISWKRLFEANAGLADLDCTGRVWEESAAQWNTAANLAHEHHDDAREAIAWRGLAEIWLGQGNLARAEPLLRRALKVFENDPFSGDQIAPTLSCLGQLYLSENKPALAEDVLTRALAKQEAMVGSKHPQVALLLELLGDTAALRNQMAVARDYFGRAQRIVEQKFGEDSPICGAVFANWGVAEQRSGDKNRAAAQYEKALTILRAGGRDVAALRMLVIERYAALLKSTHRRKEANALLAEAKSFRER